MNDFKYRCYQKIKDIPCLENAAMRILFELVVNGYDVERDDYFRFLSFYTWELEYAEVYHV